MQVCESCRFWSQMCVRSIGCAPIEALCLGDGPKAQRYTRGNDTCPAWKSNQLGQVDDPPDYGESARGVRGGRGVMTPTPPTTAGAPITGQVP